MGSRDSGYGTRLAGGVLRAVPILPFLQLGVRNESVLRPDPQSSGTAGEGTATATFIFLLEAGAKEDYD